jgi:hypothetical protein
MGKFNVWFLLLILPLNLLWFSCDEPQETVTESEVILNSDSLKRYLKNKFQNQCYLYCLDELPYLDTLRHFYASRNYEPLWWGALLDDSAKWQKLKADLSYAEVHGMDPRYYHLGMMEYYRSELDSIQDPDSTYALLAELEILTSNSLIEMYTDIANGRTDPAEVFGSILLR